MARTSINQLKERRLVGASAAERAEFDETYVHRADAVIRARSRSSTK